MFYWTDYGLVFILQVTEKDKNTLIISQLLICLSIWPSKRLNFCSLNLCKKVTALPNSALNLCVPVLTDADSSNIQISLVFIMWERAYSACKTEQNDLSCELLSNTFLLMSMYRRRELCVHIFDSDTYTNETGRWILNAIHLVRNAIYIGVVNGGKRQRNKLTATKQMWPTVLPVLLQWLFFMELVS